MTGFLASELDEMVGGEGSTAEDLGILADDFQIRMEISGPAKCIKVTHTPSGCYAVGSTLFDRAGSFRRQLLRNVIDQLLTEGWPGHGEGH